MYLVCVVKTKMLISCAVTTQLIFAFVFCMFSHDVYQRSFEQAKGHFCNVHIVCILHKTFSIALLFVFLKFTMLYYIIRGISAFYHYRYCPKIFTLDL